jgi:PAS domain S-box-containing protein
MARASVKDLRAEVEKLRQSLEAGEVDRRCLEEMLRASELRCRALAAGGDALRANLQDATERKRVEQVLRESEERFRLLVDSAPDGILVHQDGVILLANRAALQLHAVKRPEDFIGRPVLDRIHPDDHAAVRERMRLVASGVRPAPAELRALRLDGQVVELETAHEVIAYRGKPAALVIIRDVGARKRSEALLKQALQVAERHAAEIEALQEALREREQHYRSLFELSPFGVVLVSEDRAIREFNEQAHCLLGYTREEFAELTLAGLIASDTRQEARAHHQRILSHGADQFELKMKAKSGALRDVMVHARTVEVGGKKQILSIVHDVTDRNRAEEALREADRNKNHFLAMLSHELRSPLTSFRNGLFLLEHAVPGSEQARRAQEIMGRQVGLMVRLIDDLLDVTRISRAKLQLQREPLDFGEVARRTIDDLRPVFDQAGVSLEVDLVDQDLPVLADRNRLAQAIGNLLHNAAKFTPSGGRTWIALERDPEKNLGILRVRDSGIGIGSESLPLLFRPFYQVDEALDRNRGGLGLGLSLVKGLVEMHGGSVTARSEGSGQGAEFTIWLPLRSPVARTPDAAASGGSRELEEAADLAGCPRVNENG